MSNPKRLIPIYSVDRNDKKIAITFDAAWGADKTRDIIAVLNDNNVKATFFLVGFWAEKYPLEVNLLVESGMEIATHSQTHPHLNGMSREKIHEEIVGSASLIEKISNTQIRLFRAPFGEYNNTSVSICAENNIYPIQWSVDSLDWKGISAKEINERIERQVKCGSIILCHNNSDHIVEAIRTLLPKLIEKGYELVTVSDLIFKENYFIDGTGKQIEKGIR
ncbi:MAG: polysaccharide deacetylase family protein [Clostridia bacterium]